MNKKLKYAVVYDDEQWIETDYFDTEAEAIEAWKQLDDENQEWPDSAHSVQGFTEGDIKAAEAWGEAHPQ